VPNEEKIQQELSAKFNFLSGNIQIVRPRRISVSVAEYKNFRPVFEFAAKELNFIHLCMITGLDDGEVLSFIYHLAQDGGALLNIKVSIPKTDPKLNTVIDLFPGAEIYERELVDLLGVNVEGLPSGNRYPLTDDWPKDQFPLRKDWQPPKE